MTDVICCCKHKETDHQDPAPGTERAHKHDKGSCKLCRCSIYTPKGHQAPIILRASQ